jgi:hypothetical protein
MSGFFKLPKCRSFDYVWRKTRAKLRSAMKNIYKKQKQMQKQMQQQKQMQVLRLPALRSGRSG